MKPKHTPTPWQIGAEKPCAIYSKTARIKVGETAPYAITDSPAIPLANSDEEMEANAAHIVKCVNLHDELVEALIACDYRDKYKDLIARAKGES